ncbi:MAG: D-alanyl-D-alanine carboxypeptidase [Alphaproteobacteria bacterium]|nr:D-alanyl-D-alanine carboxypeptidase [Alphaproteobacteria bacterium]
MNNTKLKRLFYNIKCAVISGCITFCTTISSHAATSSIIIDADSGKVLSSSAADTLRYPASLTKVMTLYITFEALDKGLIRMDDMLPVSRTAANRSPSKLGLRAGEKISVKDAIMALVVKSANDCATVLAEGLGYSEQNFAQTMTKVAHELGMKNTTFKNASGLPNREQKTTARDMARLGAAMYHHFPQYYKLFSARKFTYKGRTYYTHNHLLKSFEGADGMKTGFTSAAGFNIITSAERNGKRVIAVTMGHNTAKLRDKKVASLMEQGLNKLAQIDSHKDYQITNNSTTAKTTISATSNTNNWAIQVGAFSNYAKARNYALHIQKEITQRYKDKDIHIQPYQNGSAVIYRSQLTGFAKNEANKACSSLKKSNKSCIVIDANTQPLILAGRF